MGETDEFRKLCEFLKLDINIQSTLMNDYGISTVQDFMVDLPSRVLENLRDQQVIGYLEYTRILGYQHYVGSYGNTAADLYQRRDNPDEIFIGFMYKYYRNIAMNDTRGEALEHIYSVLQIDEQDQKMLAGTGVVIGTALARKLPSSLLKSLKNDSSISTDTFTKIIQFQVWCKQKLDGVSNAKFNKKVLALFDDEVWADHVRPKGGAGVGRLGKGKPMKFSSYEVKRLPITVPVTTGQIGRLKWYTKDSKDSNFPPFLREGRMCCRVSLKCSIVKVLKVSKTSMTLSVRDVDGTAVISTTKKTRLDESARQIIMAAKNSHSGPGELRCISIIGQVSWSGEHSNEEGHIGILNPIVISEMNGCKLEAEVYGHALYAQYISLQYKLRTTIKEKIFQFVVGCTYNNGKGGTIPVPVDAYAFIAMTKGVIGAEDVISGFAALVNEGLVISLDDDGRYFQIKSDQFSKVASTIFEDDTSYSSVVSLPRSFEAVSVGSPKYHSGVD